MPATPPLPNRPSTAIETAEPGSEEPPPPYEPVPSGSGEQTLEYGPVRPFQDSTAAVPLSAPFQPPPGPPLPPRVNPQWTGAYSPPLTSPPPSFPFWNGSNLTPQQTGYRDPYVQPQFGGSPHAGPSPAPPLPPRMNASPGAAASSPPPLRRAPSGYKPQEWATPGQPLLYQGQLLVYGPGKECWKCSNTGYKPFDPYTGYRGDDPNHPCKNCWKKYGRPYTSAMRIALENPTSPVPPNYQRPLRLLQTPADRPVAPNVIGTTSGMPYISRNPNTLVVRPGDPRIGGVLCRRCGGSGLMMGPFIFDEVNCDHCNGAGRVFV